MSAVLCSFALVQAAPASEHHRELAPEDAHVVRVDEQVEAVHRLGALEEEAPQDGEQGGEVGRHERREPSEHTPREREREVEHERHCGHCHNHREQLCG